MTGKDAEHALCRLWQRLAMEGRGCQACLRNLAAELPQGLRRP